MRRYFHENQGERSDDGPVLRRRKRAYYLNTFVYLLDPAAKTLGYIGPRSIFGAMAACETRSFSVDEALNIIRNGMAPEESAAPVFHIPHDGWKFPEELMVSVCVPRDTFQFYHEKMRDRYAALLIPQCRGLPVAAVPADKWGDKKASG